MRSRFVSFAALMLAAAILGPAPAARAQFPPQTSPPHKPHPPATADSVAKGKELFQGTCANCHGIDGSGANGPNIQNAAATWGPEGLYTRMTSGAIGTAMPNFSFLGDDKIWEIADYVSSLGQHGAGVVLGDPQKGKALYESNGCATCHSIAGRGGSSGPDLTTIGSQRAAAMLRNELVDPGANLPPDTAGLSERAAYSAYAMYRATLTDGKQIEGTRVNEDSFSIQLRDAKGELRSIQKYEVRKIEQVPGKSFMPSVKGKLSDEQLNDLVAYLAGLGGAQ
ncbi:MAG TPA: c-type cytochrome [Verrucomicrobiae bacterium]|nr:c-type cytochrome [Verrucomicrobiae bacterium]